MVILSHSNRYRGDTMHIAFGEWPPSEPLVYAQEFVVAGVGTSIEQNSGMPSWYVI